MSTDRRPHLGDMPDWPLMLAEAQAAAYVGVSVNTFKTRIGNPWPEPVRMGRRKLYDRRAIERAVDTFSRSRLDSPTEAVRQWREQNVRPTKAR